MSELDKIIEDMKNSSGNNAELILKADFKLLMLDIFIGALKKGDISEMSEYFRKRVMEQ